jgi:hypothetical protein
MSRRDWVISNIVCLRFLERLENTFHFTTFRRSLPPIVGIYPAVSKFFPSREISEVSAVLCMRLEA